MSNFKLEGEIKMIGEKVNVSDKFAKREIVITDTTGMYPQDIMFQFTQDKCDLLNGLSVGQKVEVSFNLRGREWTSPTGEVKYFNTLEGWRLDLAGGAPNSPATQAATPNDGLPF